MFDIVGRNGGLGLGSYRVPAAGFGLGLIDFLGRHPGFQNAHELAGSVAEFFDPGAD